MNFFKRIPAAVVVQNEHFRQMLRYDLYLGGFEVHTFTDVSDFLKASRRPKVNLILVDADECHYAVSQLRAESNISNVPVIAFTNGSTIADIENVFQAGANDYIAKPFSSETIAQVVKQKLKKCSSAIKKADKKKIPVVLIDDDAGLRRLVEFTLNSDGFKVHSAPDGPSGIYLIKKVKPALVLLDIIMPQMDGLEVLSTLKYDRKTSRIPVIMLTGESTIGTIDRAYNIGAVGYITKPVRGRELGKTIRETLASLKSVKV